MTVGDPEDVVKEIHGASVGRVDAVAGPAHGMPFLILKAMDAPIVKADADAIADADGDDAMALAKPTAAGLPVPTDAPGDPDVPGSPAWEAVDAAKGRWATQQMLALKSLIEELAARESAEASAGLADGDTNAWDLADVCGAIDFAVGVLARYASTEQHESAEAAADVEDAARELGLLKGLEVDADALIEFAKAGRVLSSKNESALRSAAESINNVLATLPAATEESVVAKSEDEQLDDALAVQKSDGGASTLAAPAAADTAGDVNAVALDVPAEAQPTDSDAPAVVKAKGKPQVAVYDANGKLVGTIDQADLNPIASAAPPEGGDAETPADAPADDAAVTPAAEAAPAAPAATDTPAPAAGMDDTEVQKALDNPVFKAVIDKLVEERLTPLKDELEILKASPAADATLMHGALPPAINGITPPPADTPEVTALRKALEAETSPHKRATLELDLATQMVRSRVGR